MPWGMLPSSDNEVAIRVLMLFMVALIASAVRFMVVPRLGNPLAYVRSALLGILGCIVTYFYCIDMGLTVVRSLIFSGIAAATADDIVRGALLLLLRWKDNPDGLISKIISWRSK